MSITFNCRNEKCKARYTVPDECAGKKATCKKCRKRVQVPWQLEEVAASPMNALILSSNASDKETTSAHKAGTEPTQSTPKPAANDQAETSDEISALHIIFAVPLALLFLFFGVIIISIISMPTGWTYYYYGYWWCLIPAVLSYLVVSVVFGTPAFIFSFWPVPQIALSIFMSLFALPDSPLPTVDEKNFYGEWIHYSKNYDDKDWKSRTKTTIEIIPKWA